MNPIQTAQTKIYHVMRCCQAIGRVPQSVDSMHARRISAPSAVTPVRANHSTGQAWAAEVDRSAPSARILRAYFSHLRWYCVRQGWRLRRLACLQPSGSGKTAAQTVRSDFGDDGGNTMM